MATAITHVQPGSIAERLGLKEGDQLVSIAGEPIIDQIDYTRMAKTHCPFMGNFEQPRFYPCLCHTIFL